MKFTRTHEWILIEGDEGTVGITSYARKELGDVVYVELPPVGKKLKQGEEAVVLESTKAASDIYAPVSGTVTAVNENLAQEIQDVNNASEGKGWLFKMKIADPSKTSQELEKLLTQEEYLALVKREG